MSDRSLSRRRYLGGLATAAASGLAGCSGVLGDQESNESATEPPTTDAGNGTADGSESPYTQVYRDAMPSVVLLNVTTASGEGQGSGFVFRDEYVVTNEHVVADATDVQVRFSRGEWRSASVVGTDVSSDLAVVQVDDRPDYADDLRFREDEPAIGTEVVAIGNPFGRFDGSASAGIVSGVNRSIPAQNGYTIPDAVQTDAAVNPGNSGGPLVDLDGRVAGVINSGGGENIAFAISAALARRVVPALVEDGDYTHAYVGVGLATVTPALAEANGLERPRGVYVDRVLGGGPSDGALQGSDGRQRVDGAAVPTGGDVVVGIGGTAVDTRQQLSSYLALQASPGEAVDVTVLRDGEERTVTVELGERPERPGAGVGGTETPNGRR
ncbi:S1C family serine protease [Halomarina salina]|uniref:S1C family serine protease n=1 Tax=Halomarina salina TaxID=1872699 RepID=A0ABD5RPC0_9EURY|nr:trypsin-like peptidase domain-containing protein [Halomarina salina]